MVVDLTWEWRLADEGDDSSAPILVPGDEISTLEAGLIPDNIPGAMNMTCAGFAIGLG